jgi:hypothetical protein
MLKDLREITLVNQTEKDNCVAACLSMVTGIDLEKVEQELKISGGEAPYSSEDYIKFLVRKNIYPEYSGRGMKELLSDDTIYLMLCSGAFNPATAHMIVGVMYKGCMQIFDPNDNLENEKIYCSAKYNKGDIPVFQYISLTDCEI